MRIGIEINGVLRDTIGKFQQLYEKHLIDSFQDIETQTFNLDESGNTELNVVSEPFEYKIISPVTSLELKDHFNFKNDEELFSFMYEEFAMELFGHAPSTEMTSFNDLNDVYYNLRDNHDLVIISDEIGKSKPASLFFLSKFGCQLEKVKFYSNYTINSMWDEIDILLTANPKLLLDYPPNKMVIKFETQYNENIDAFHTIKKIKELEQKIKEVVLC